MRCLVVTANEPSAFGGVERFVWTLIHSLSVKGISFEVLHQGLITFRPAWYDRYGIGEARKALYISRAASAKIRNTNYDLAIVNGITGWAMHSSIPVINIHHGTIRGASLAMSRVMRDAGVAVRLKRAIITVMGYYGVGSLERISVTTAMINVAVSVSTAEELVKFYGVEPNKIRIIQNGVDIDHFKPLDRYSARAALGLPQDRFVVLFSGRNELRKGVDILIQLAQLLRTTDPATLMIAATDRSLKDPNIISMEKVGYQDLPTLYNAADVFVFPSRYEGCSFSVIEAMACGLPIVMTDVGHARDIKEQSGILAPYIIPVDSSPGLFADLILSIKRDAAKRHIISGEARRYVLEHNSMQAMAESYLNLFHEIIDSERSDK